MLGGALQDSFPAGSVHVSMFNIVVMLISALGGLLASSAIIITATVVLFAQLMDSQTLLIATS